MSQNAHLWIIIVSLGVGSFCLRFLFLGLVGNRDLPPWLLRHLRYTAVAMLPALVAPLVIWPAATNGMYDPARLAAAAITMVIGAYTKNLLLAMIAGAITLFFGLYLSA
ncbi:AzlD domain-containing protein [Pseudopelagicola sp. nBUS_19]|uniref:AzlD domain-containing protein n=1 Tax=unclassified Pseudopelagicola TaxID=2649563 RepID=UPI003EBB023C